MIGTLSEHVGVSRLPRPISIGLIDTKIVEDPQAKFANIRSTCSTIAAKIASGLLVPASDTHVRASLQLLEQLAPNADVYLAEAIGKTSQIEGVIDALEWFLEIKPDLVCCPFGFPVGNPVFDALFTQLASQSIVVASIGNVGPGKYLNPGYRYDVISVGSAEQNYSPTRFSGSMNTASGFCLRPDFLFTLHGTQNERRGTSISAVGLAGVLASSLRYLPKITTETAIELLRNKAKAIDGVNEIRSCYGVIIDDVTLAKNSRLTINHSLPKPSATPAITSPWIDPAIQRCFDWQPNAREVRVILGFRCEKNSMVFGNYDENILYICNAIEKASGEQFKDLRISSHAPLAITTSSLALLKVCREHPELEFLSHASFSDLMPV